MSESAPWVETAGAGVTAEIAWSCEELRAMVEYWLTLPAEPAAERHETILEIQLHQAECPACREFRARSRSWIAEHNPNLLGILP